MKKIYVVVMFAAVLMMTGCSKIKTNKLEGFWSRESEYSSSHSCMVRHDVFNFINYNTVQYLGHAFTEPVTMPHHDLTTPLSDKNGWYYRGYCETLTYVFEDNKVILSDGKIFTYMDNKLYWDGDTRVLERW